MAPYKIKRECSLLSCLVDARRTLLLTAERVFQPIVSSRHSADIQCMPEGWEEAKGQRKKFMFTFPWLTLEEEFSFHHYVAIFWRRKWQPTPVFLPGESHGQRSLVSYSPQGRKESDMTYRLNNNSNVSTHVNMLGFFLISWYFKALP